MARLKTQPASINESDSLAKKYKSAQERFLSGTIADSSTPGMVTPHVWCFCHCCREVNTQSTGMDNLES